MEKEEATLHTCLKSGRVEREGHFQMRGRKRRPRYVVKEDRRGHVIYVGVGGKEGGLITQLRERKEATLCSRGRMRSPRYVGGKERGGHIT